MFVNYQGKGLNIGDEFPAWSGSQNYTLDMFNEDRDAWNLMNKTAGINSGIIDTTGIDIDSLTMDQVYDAYANIDDINSYFTDTNVLEEGDASYDVNLEGVDVPETIDETNLDEVYKEAAKWIDGASYDDTTNSIVDSTGNVLYQGDQEGLLSALSNEPTNEESILSSIFDTEFIDTDLINQNPEQVAKYQQELVDAGFDIGPSGVDSVWGPDTQSAWEAFNQSKQAGEHWYPGKYIAGGLGALSDALGGAENTINRAGEKWYPGKYIGGGLDMAGKGMSSGGNLLMSALQGIQNLVPEENRPKIIEPSGTTNFSGGMHKSAGEFDMPILEGLLNMIRK
tara:strand:- start:476 stop:1492 length:1017 start_codon:yes stop_codon:yes gene_type:complete